MALVLKKAARLIALVMLLGTTSAFAAEKNWTATFQVGAFAPNAGGQDAYGLRVHRDNREYTLFSNSYLMAGAYPLTGAIYSWRFPICDETCWWQFFAQIGAGVSTAGPLAEIVWGSQIPLAPLWLPRSAPKYLPSLRFDVTTHMIAVPYRLVLWSYPLWLGISVPF